MLGGIFGGFPCGFFLGLFLGKLSRVYALVNEGLQAARFGSGVVKIPGANVADCPADGLPVQLAFKNEAFCANGGAHGKARGFGVPQEVLLRTFGAFQGAYSFRGKAFTFHLWLHRLHGKGKTISRRLPRFPCSHHVAKL